MSYFVDGVITDNQQVSLTILREEVLQNPDGSYSNITITSILTRNNDNSYNWVDVDDVSNIPSNYAIFYVNISETETAKNPSNFYLKNITTKQWLIFTKGSNLPTNSDNKPQYFKGKQNLYQPWYKPFAFFPGVIYNITNYDDINISNNISFIPIEWYKSDDCNLVSSLESIKDHFNWVLGSPISSQGWINKEDCKQQVDYIICSINNYCSTSCKGPCLNKNSECKWINEQFSCGGNLFFSWWYSITFIVILLIFILIIVVGIIISFFRHPKIKDLYGDDIDENDKILTVDQYNKLKKIKIKKKNKSTMAAKTIN